MLFRLRLLLRTQVEVQEVVAEALRLELGVGHLASLLLVLVASSEVVEGFEILVSSVVMRHGVLRMARGKAWRAMVLRSSWRVLHGYLVVGIVEDGLPVRILGLLLLVLRLAGVFVLILVEIELLALDLYFYVLVVSASPI